MNEINQSEPKQRILDAAATLFARKGYAAVGVREIAAEANINISMISYYFGGKVGLLTAIIEEFFKIYKEQILNSLEMDLPFEQNIRNIIRSIVKLIKSKPDFCKVAIFEMPYDLPEITEFKASIIKELANTFIDFFSMKLQIRKDRLKIMTIIGPGLISLVFSNFLIGEVVKKSFNIEFDEDFYDIYTKTISTLFFSGISGVLKELQINEGAVI